MTPNKVGNVLNWATDIDPNALEQAFRTARLPFIHSHVALMPDAHFGLGATVGSVIATKGAIIPAAVGVDIGCGMIAVETSLTSQALPDSLGPLHGKIREAVPAGVGNDDVEPRRQTRDNRRPERSGLEAAMQEQHRRARALLFDPALRVPDIDQAP